MSDEQLSFQEAKRLSIKKWKMHVDAGGFCDGVDNDNELKHLPCNCGFCERWMRISCDNCEFGKIAGVCQSEGYSDLYSKWTMCFSVESAQKILDTIINLEENK